MYIYDLIDHFLRYIAEYDSLTRCKLTFFFPVQASTFGKVLLGVVTEILSAD